MTTCKNSRYFHSRIVAWLCCFAGLLATQEHPRLAVAQDKQPVVHVLLQLDAKSSVLEKILKERLPDLAITVFGRYRDFEEGVNTGHPDAILSITPVLALHGKEPALQGQRGGKSAEPYVLVSVNQPIEGSLTGKTIGIVDILGRDGTQAFLTGLLKTSGVKPKRVAKVEDLLPLLEFSAADGIVLPNSMMSRLTERTRLPLKTKELPGGPVGLPGVAVLNPAVRDLVVKSFQRLDGSTKSLMGFDSWSIR